MEIEEDVVIVGGGIAGLATALALKRIGIQSLVLEQSSDLRTTGTSLLLFPNAWLALYALGVSHKLTSIYAPLEKGYVTKVSNKGVEEVLNVQRDRSMSLTIVHRKALLEALSEELPGHAIRYSSKLSLIETVNHEGSPAVLHLEDGAIIKAKVVIGCDGVHSVVARWLGLKDPIHSGRYAVRGLTVFPEGHGMKHEAQQSVNGSIRTSFIPLNDKELHWFVIFNSTPDKDDNMTGKSPEEMVKSVLDTLVGFPSVFLDVIQHSDLSTVTLSQLMFRVPWDLLLNDMYKDNITVAGDAMHPMTPDLGQGGCSSLEDAVVLARHIGNYFILNGKIDSRALKGYVKERRFRASMLITLSYLSGRVQQGGSGWFTKFLRDKVYYKFFGLLFGLLFGNVLSYDCGKLPSMLLTSKKLE
ncbi:Monooxygenase [Thalictrum thalictroides]|uniref:Monooxygenase n=1 Tax=Thalictrum thalictroides TaxID=46969 RepID=A0A7J6V0R7_THATH|nr:Monooxygenase [Thalictrum thalictroides]